MQLSEILAELHQKANSKSVEQMKKFGILPEKTFDGGDEKYFFHWRGFY